MDITSLYPHVNKNKTYQVGHPHILVNPENQDIHSYFGTVKVKILASPKLYHPLLPKMINNKLMFPLCGKCVEEQYGKALVETKRDLYSHWTRKMHDWNLVHTRVAKSGGVGILGEENLWSLAFPWRSSSRWFVCWVCQQVAQKQARSNRIAERLCDRGPKSSIHSGVWRKRGRQAWKRGRSENTDVEQVSDRVS